MADVVSDDTFQCMKTYLNQVAWSTNQAIEVSEQLLSHLRSARQEVRLHLHALAVLDQGEFLAQLKSVHDELDAGKMPHDVIEASDIGKVLA